MAVNEDFPPCSARQHLVAFKRDGTKEPVQRCTEKTADKFGLDVLPADCEACPVRHMITAAAMKRQEYKPPLVAELATIHDVKPDEDAPSPWLPCADRNLVTIGGCCGKGRPIRVCDSPDCFRLGSEVNPEMCRVCPHRRG